MEITQGSLFDLLYNNGMLNVLIRIVSIINTHNIQFYDKIKKKIPLNICFLELSEKFPRDSKTSSN